jgi:hypothetical protein
MEPLVEDDNAPDTYVSLSGIHGCGLFANKKFEAGEIVVDYNLFSDHYREDDYFNLSQEIIDRGWFLVIEGSRCLTTDTFSKFSYINHSRSPNCVWLRERRIICAARVLKKDTELFIDYRIEPLPPGAKAPSWY